MSRIKTKDLHDYLIAKKEKYSIDITARLDGLRISSTIKGNTAKRFLDDCIKRELNESKMVGIIIDTYYSAIDVKPELKEKEPNAIKQFIIDRIKFE